MSELAGLLTTPEPWQDAALCRTHPDPDLWYVDGSTRRDAKAICRTCPALDPCRTHALTAPEKYGVWGGLDEDERAAIWKRKNR